MTGPYRVVPTMGPHGQANHKVVGPGLNILHPEGRYECAGVTRAKADVELCNVAWAESAKVAFMRPEDDSGDARQKAEGVTSGEMVEDAIDAVREALDVAGDGLHQCAGLFELLAEDVPSCVEEAALRGLCGCLASVIRKNRFSELGPLMELWRKHVDARLKLDAALQKSVR